MDELVEVLVFVGYEVEFGLEVFVGAFEGGDSCKFLYIYCRNLIKIVLNGFILKCSQRYIVNKAFCATSEVEYFLFIALHFF